jgi:hypothetical protein
MGLNLSMPYLQMGLEPSFKVTSPVYAKVKNFNSSCKNG